jgi:hypothetical protein
MNYLRSACLSLIAALSVVHFMAQAAPPKPPDQPKAEVKLTAPPSKEKDALNAAIHKKDTADKAVSDLSLRVAQIQQQAQQQFAQLDAQQKAADKAVAEAEAAILKEMKLDPEKYAFNRETMEATAKPEAKPAEVKK